MNNICISAIAPSRDSDSKLFCPWLKRYLHAACLRLFDVRTLPPAASLFAHYQRLWGTEHVGHGHLNTRHSSLWLLCFWLISQLGVSRKCSSYAAYDLTSKTKVMKPSKVCAVWRIPPCIKWISVTFITWLQFWNKYVWHNLWWICINK